MLKVFLVPVTRDTRDYPNSQGQSSLMRPSCKIKAEFDLEVSITLVYFCLQRETVTKTL